MFSCQSTKIEKRMGDKDMHGGIIFYYFHSMAASVCPLRYHMCATLDLFPFSAVEFLWKFYRRISSIGGSLGSALPLPPRCLRGPKQIYAKEVSQINISNVRSQQLGRLGRVAVDSNCVGMVQDSIPCGSAEDLLQKSLF